MRLVLWGKGQRGASCLERLVRAERRPTLVVLQPPASTATPCPVAVTAQRHGIPTFAPDHPNDDATLDRLRSESADIFVLAGYGKILQPATFDLPARMTINTHAGKLPQYRGSSPLNWALINDEQEFTLSVIRVDAGVDSGDVLAERAFPIADHDTICDLHRVANEQFPQMMLEVLDAIEHDNLAPRNQDARHARYFPLRFPDDGAILWDQLSAREVHNRIRALRPPYPGAFTFFDGRRVKLIASQLADEDVRGEPGRVYRRRDGALLVCARDRCLWIRQAEFADDGRPLAGEIQRYDRLATLQAAACEILAAKGALC